MKWFVSSVFLLSWGLWLGGVVAILLLVQRLFQYDRNTALSAAPQMFLVFEKYQLTLAAATVVSVAGNRGRRRFVALLPLVLAAAVCATTSALFITPRIEHLRLVGEQRTAAFSTLHGLSMLIYLIEVMVLLAAGVILARPASESV